MNLLNCIHPYKLQKNSEQATFSCHGESKLADLSAIELTKTSIKLSCFAEGIQNGFNFVCDGYFFSQQIVECAGLQVRFMKFRIWCRQDLLTFVAEYN